MPGSITHHRRVHPTSRLQIRDFVYITDNAYVKDDILQMETAILNTLSFNLEGPTPYLLLPAYLKAVHADMNSSVALYATYLLERAMVEYKYLDFKPSRLAMAATLLSMLSHGFETEISVSPEVYSDWYLSLFKITRRTIQHFAPEMTFLGNVLDGRIITHVGMKAVDKKYSSVRYGEVATKVKMVAAYTPPYAYSYAYAYGLGS